MQDYQKIIVIVVLCLLFLVYIFTLGSMHNTVNPHKERKVKKSLNRKRKDPNEVEIEYLNKDGSVKQKATATTKKTPLVIKHRLTSTLLFLAILSVILEIWLVRPHVENWQLFLLTSGSFLLILGFDSISDVGTKKTRSGLFFVGLISVVISLLPFGLASLKILYLLLGIPSILLMAHIYFNYLHNRNPLFVIVAAFLCFIFMMTMAVVSSIVYKMFLVGTVLFLLGIGMLGYAFYILIAKLLKI